MSRSFVTSNVEIPWYAFLEGELDDEPVLENCERCGHLMPEGCVGWCAECDAQVKAAIANEDFWEWGGWRRAFHDDGEPYVPGTVCRASLRLVVNG